MAAEFAVMADPTLRAEVERRFGVTIDPDADGGRILDRLRPQPPLDATALSGRADVAPLTFGISPRGISIAAADASDALVLALPGGPIEFRIVPPAAGDPVRVELTLGPLTVRVPFLRPAEPAPDGTLRPVATGDVTLHLPDLLLVITASGEPSATTVGLAPAGAPGGLVATMHPRSALLGARPATDAVVGLTFDRATLDLDDPAGPSITVPELRVHLAPPGIPALAMEGAGTNLRLGLGLGGGLSGTFELTGSAAAAAQRPRFLRDVSARLRLDRNVVTALTLSGTIDIAGEINARVGAVGDAAAAIRYDLALTLDAGWRAALTMRAAAGGGHLWRARRPNPDATNRALDTLGALTVFTPLLAPNPPASAPGGFVELGLAAGAAASLGTSGALTTQSIVLHGAELVVRQPAGAAAEAYLFFDLETQVDLKVELGGVELLRSRRPLAVRHRAIGLRLEFGPPGGVPQLRPVFDRTRGFGLELSDPGLLGVPGPIGDIIAPTAARIARQNPIQLEVDLALKADLGIVTVDKASVRVPLDPPGAPTLTALGAHVDVPGGVTGGGYLRLEPGGFAGHLDVAIAPPLGLRAAAGLAIRQVDAEGSGEQLTGVLMTLEVELPVPIPLANSGLGLYGFLGLLGVHHERRQDPPQTALDWFVAAGGTATTLSSWRGKADAWALGLGAVIGTVEGGFLFHAKGMIVLELPGPRVLIVMKADLLAARPSTKAPPASGRLLTVIEIRPESVTIGVVAEYGLAPLLELRVPAEAFFDFRRAENWHLAVGGIPPKLPVSVRFLSSLRADGYLVIAGDGIPDFPPRPLHGFSVAAGVRAAFTWGPEAIGLYLRVSAQADVGISFKPMLVSGTLTLRGELHLFVISIEASAAATVLITPDTFFVSAEVCGSVDFFFFDVEGCVSIELGTAPTQLPAPAPLLRAMSLHSRVPALVMGSTSGAPIDGSLGDAALLDPSTGEWVGDVPVVPIDAIPVLQFDTRPVVDPASSFLGRPVPSKLPANGWTRRGERFYRYTLRSLTLAATTAAGAAMPSVVDAGETPTAWWDRRGRPSGGEDNDVQLALLSWVPDATPAAAERTATLDERLRQRWGSICTQAAPPARVLWAFHGAPAGPSATGWTLHGTAWPDEPGVVRSAPPPLVMRVRELWRPPSALGAGLVDADPAVVYGADDIPGHFLVSPRAGHELMPKVPDDDEFRSLFDALVTNTGDRLGDAVRIDAGGFVELRLLLVVSYYFGLDGTLVVRPIDGDGAAMGDIEVAYPHAQEFQWPVAPWEWTDADGPWHQPVVDAIEACGRYQDAWSTEMFLALMSFELPAGTAQVEIGLVNEVQWPGHASWGLLIADGITAAELGRFTFDEDQRRRDIDLVNGALGADQAKRALLQPDATYTVNVDYDVRWANVGANGNPDDAGAQTLTGQTQQFRFRTADEPPDRLDPWVMATSPGDGEAFCFHGEPLRVVFATNATRKLFAAYGHTLSVVARAASGNHPQGEAIFAGIGAIVRTPFEDALLDAVSDGDCVDIRDSDRHERLTLALPLEPLTDYVFDIEATPAIGPPEHPLFRRHFSTSRYASATALAAAVAAAPVLHRAVHDASALLALRPQPGRGALAVDDARFELVLRALRWGDLTRSTEPRITVIWGKGSGPAAHAALALVVETPEPVWRWRDVPVHDGGRWRRGNAPWLDVVDLAGSIDHFVHSTDGARTIAVVSPLSAALGANLSLGLRRRRHVLFEGDSATETAPLFTGRITVRPPWAGAS